MRRVHDILGKDRILVIPTMPGIAPRLDASEEEFESFRFRAISSLAIAGLSGCPQLSLPVATVHGCPLGLSLVGPPGRDRALIAVARAVMA
jgi:amidase